MSWEPVDFDFDAYALNVVQAEQQSPFAAKEEAVDSQGQRKAGRHKRASVLCQVEGCGIELVSAKTYYKRYRICVEHCNAPSLVVDGRRQRFCQQCGRFHDIGEFDTNRKSCRFKLKRHNERRRGSLKSRKGKNSDSEYEEDISSDEFEHSGQYNKSTAPRKSTRVRSGNKKPNTNGNGSKSSDCSAPSDPNSQRTSPSYDNNNTTQARQVSPLPLSLTERLLSATRGTLDGLHIMPGGGSDSQGQQSGGGGSRSLSAAQDNSKKGSFSDAAATVATTSNETTRQQPTMVVTNGHTNQQQQPVDAARAPAATYMQQQHYHRDILDDTNFLNFLKQEEATTQPGASPFMPLPPTHQQQQQANVLQLPEIDIELLDFLGDVPLMPPSQPPEMFNAHLISIPGVANPPLPSSFPQPTPLLLPATSGMQPAYDAAFSMTDPFNQQNPRTNESGKEDKLIRLSLKVFNCRPDELVPAIRSELENLLSVSKTFAEGYIRPGCTHMTVNILADPAMEAVLKQDGLKRFVGDLINGGKLNSGATRNMTVQVDNELVVVKDGAPVAVIDTGSSSALVPVLAAVRPLAVVAGHRKTSLMLAGHRINNDKDLVMCRQHGRNLTVQPFKKPDYEDYEVVQADVLGLAPGFADVEVQRNGLLGTARPVLVSKDENIVNEIRQLERDTAGVRDVDAFVRKLGLIVQYLDREAAVREGRATPWYNSYVEERFARIARDLCVTCVARGFTHTLRMLLPAVTADRMAGDDAVDAMNALSPSGYSFLHLVVGRGNLDILQIIADWGVEQGISWQLDTKGTFGITPLHLAALFGNCYELKAILRRMSTSVSLDKLWGVVQADDGTTPEALQDALAADVCGVDAAMASGIGASSSAAFKATQRAINYEEESSDEEDDVTLASRINNKARLSAKDRLIAEHLEALARELESLDGLSGGTRGANVTTAFRLLPGDT